MRKSQNLRLCIPFAPAICVACNPAVDNGSKLLELFLELRSPDVEEEIADEKNLAWLCISWRPFHTRSVAIGRAEGTASGISCRIYGSRRLMFETIDHRFGSGLHVLARVSVDRLLSDCLSLLFYRWLLLDSLVWRLVLGRRPIALVSSFGSLWWDCLAGRGGVGRRSSIIASESFLEKRCLALCAKGEWCPGYICSRGEGRRLCGNSSKSGATNVMPRNVRCYVDRKRTMLTFLRGCCSVSKNNLERECLLSPRRR